MNRVLGLNLENKDLGELQTPPKPTQPEENGGNGGKLYGLDREKGNKSLDFIKNQMYGLQKSIVSLNNMLNFHSNPLDAKEVQDKITEIKGSIAAFRKLIKNRSVKKKNVWTDGDYESFAMKLKGDCKLMLTKYVTGQRTVIEKIDQIGEALQRKASYVTIDNKEKMPRFSEAEQKLFLKLMVCAQKEGSSHGFSSLLQNPKEEETCLKMLREGNVDDAFKKIKRHDTENWFVFVRDLSAQYRGNKEKWSGFESALEKMADKGEFIEGKYPTFNNKKTFDDSKKLVESPDEKIGKELLDKADQFIRELDELHQSMKSDLSVYKTAYYGSVDSSLPEAAHIYGTNMEGKQEISEELYKGDFSFKEDEYKHQVLVTNMTAPLENSEILEYRTLYGHIKAKYATDENQNPILNNRHPRPESKDLTRQNLADLRDLAKTLDYIVSPSDDSVSSVMQHEIDKSYVNGLGTKDDKGTIKIFMDLVDTTRKLRKKPEVLETVKDLDDFFESCQDLRWPGEGENTTDWFKDLLNIAGKMEKMENLSKATEAAEQLVKLELDRHAKENISEINSHIRKLIWSVAGERNVDDLDNHVASLLVKISNLVGEKITKMSGAEEFPEDKMTALKDLLTRVYLAKVSEDVKGPGDEPQDQDLKTIVEAELMGLKG